MIKKRDQQCQDEVTVKTEKFQEEVALGSKRKRVGDTQLKMKSNLTLVQWHNISYIHRHIHHLELFGMILTCK